MLGVPVLRIMIFWDLPSGPCSCNQGKLEIFANSDTDTRREAIRAIVETSSIPRKKPYNAPLHTPQYTPFKEF